MKFSALPKMSSRRVSFKPMKYGSRAKSVTPLGTPSGNPNRQVRFLPETGTIVVSKGPGDTGETNITLDDTRARLHRLRSVANTPIRSLAGSDLDDFRTLVSNTKLLYGTDAYKILHDEYRRVFGDVSPILPGTVGANFAGCLIKTSFSEMPGCSVICAGSAPLPPNEPSSELPLTTQQGQGPADTAYVPQADLGSFCQYSVVWGLFDGQRYDFTTLHDTENKDDVIVFVNSAKPSFQGFSDDEKELLRKFGAKRINVIRYSPDSKHYHELLGGFVDLNSVPSRVDVVSNYQEMSSNNILIILLIVLVLIVVFIGWRIINK
jgi:hypothetical protein